MGRRRSLARSAPAAQVGRREFLKSAALGAAALALPPRLFAAGNEPRPNVVVILTDDQRWDAMSCAGNPLLKTPSLDRLAAEGARFANMFVTTSLCSPSRASMLSGLYAHAHGVVSNFADYPNGLPSFPRGLHAAGYATAYIGKWHMNENSDEARPGFDHWASHKGQGKYYDTELNVNGKREVLKGYYTTRVTDLALEWLGRPRGKPFLLMLGHKAPHSPNTPEPKYEHLFDDAKIEYPPTAFHLDGKPDWVRQRLNTWHGIYGPLWGFRKEFPDTRPEGVAAFAAFVRAYLATIKSVDDSVGRLYDALKESGQLDNTLLIFLGDNGFFLGEHGMMDKRTMHEASIRVPLLVRYPRLIKAGTVVGRMVLNVDLAPSILDICGAEPLPRVHGKSWKKLVTGDAAGPGPSAAEGWRTSWFYAYNYEKQFPYTPNVRGVRTDEWKYIHYPHGDGGPDRHKAELYNLKDDPRETRNLVDDPACADRLAGLKAELHRLMEAAGALPDRTPLDEGVKETLPDRSIR
jgi:N-acetylglucosamine-6-sulfatase